MSQRQLQVNRFTQRTVPQLFWATATDAPERVFLRALEFDGQSLNERAVSYGEFCDQVIRVAAFLKQEGVGPGDGVLLLAENSPEWQVFAMAATLLQAVPAAAFANLGAEPVQDICARTEPKAIFVSSQAQWDKLAEIAGPELLLYRDELASTPAVSKALSWRDCLEHPPLSAEAAKALVDGVKAEHAFLQIFTSGTTGRQKAVLVKQSAFVAALDNFRSCTEMTEGDLGLMFLPYAHIAGQAQFHLAHASGHTLIHVARRDDILGAFELGPTYTLAVPLIYERIFGQVQAQIESKPAPLRALLKAAMQAAATIRCDQTGSWKDRLLTFVFDRTIAKGVKKKLGGRIRALFAGGAASPTHLFRFFESLNIPYVSAYGMSETAAMIVTNAIGLPRAADCAGYPSADIDIQIAPDGEVCVKGALVFDEYLDATDNAGAFTEEGYFRTGDLGQWAEPGYLRLGGRKKDLLILATGKKIAPAPLEALLSSAAPIEAAVLLGDGQSFVAAALFVPEAQLTGLGEAAQCSLLAMAQQRLQGASSYEVPKKLLLIPGSPADYEGILTPSFKLKRGAFNKRFKSEIEALFAPAPP